MKTILNFEELKQMFREQEQDEHKAQNDKNELYKAKCDALRQNVELNKIKALNAIKAQDEKLKLYRAKEARTQAQFEARQKKIDEDYHRTERHNLTTYLITFLVSFLSAISSTIILIILLLNS